MSSAEPGTEQPAATDGVRNSWVPTIGLFLAQMLMSFNVAALPVSMGGIVEDFGVPPTTVANGGRDRFFALLNSGRQD